MTPIVVGSEIDGFRVGERIHSGAMAVLYAVSGRDAGFPLLMKVPRLGHGERAESVISFEIEQRVLGALAGPHVPRLVASGDLGRQPYLVMERVEGTSLREWTRRAPLPWADVVRLGGAVAAALAAIHGQGAIHLDVKPANVVLRPDGRAVLIDFGVARHARHPDPLAEELRDPVGSAPYVAPEQVMGVRWDPRSDLFALGAVLYELATGELPFGAPSSPGALRRRAWREPRPPRALAPGLPPWVQEIVLRCLEPAAEDRYATAELLALDLAHADRVEITARGRRTRRGGAVEAFRRWSRRGERARRAAPAPGSPAIVLVAIAPDEEDGAQLAALREAASRIRAGEQRLACVTVVRPAPELGGSDKDETAARRRIRHLVALRRWAEPLDLDPARLSLHVLEAADAAEAIVRYARANRVAHVLVGAPPRVAALQAVLGPASGDAAADASPLPLLRLVGTVSTRIAAAAPCTVTLVRAPGAPGAPASDRSRGSRGPSSRA